MARALAMPDTLDWHSARQAGIGASESAACCGQDEYRTPLDLYHVKRGNMAPFSGNNHTVWGKRLEPVILQAFEEDTGANLEYPVPLFQHDEHEWMLATPDGLEIHTDTNEPCATIEAKSTNWRMAKKMAEESVDEISLSWICQVQHQMAVLNLGSAWVVVLVDARELKPVLVQRDDAQIAAIMAAEAEMWERIVNADPPPANYDADLPVLKSLTHVTPGKSITLDDSARALIKMREWNSEAIKYLKQCNERIEAQLWEILGESEVAYLSEEQEIARTWIPPTTYTKTVERKGYWKLGKPRKRRKRITMEGETE